MKKQPKRFKKVYIEITNVCHLNCSFCPKTKRKAGWISPTQFEYILNQIKPYTDYIYLHVLGEPLLHQDLDELLDSARRMEMKVQITTNGTLLQKTAPILLKDNRVRQINISLHSFEANETTQTLEEYVGEVVDFVKQASTSTDTMCSIRLWNETSDTFAEVENKLNSQILDLLAKAFEIKEDIGAHLANKASYKIGKGVYINSDRRFQWPDKDLEVIKEKVFCYGLRDHIGILVDGTVVPCCLDSEGTINLGNIYEVPLEDILTSVRATRLYEGFSHREAVEALCKRCEYATRY